MRHIVGQKKMEYNSLEKEIEQIKLYSKIEEIRFGDRLNFTYSISKELLLLKLPIYILQPIIENASKYGLYDSIVRLFVCLS